MQTSQKHKLNDQGYCHTSDDDTLHTLQNRNTVQTDCLSNQFNSIQKGFNGMGNQNRRDVQTELLNTVIKYKSK